MSTENDGKPTADAGARLRAARDVRGISLREIAATTKISVSALEAVEQTDVASLPGGIFTRAFVRAYATEVGLDPEETVRDFMAQVAEAQVAEAAPADSRSRDYDLFQSQQRMAGVVVKLLLVALPVALLLFFGTRGIGTPAEETAAPAPVVALPAAASPPPMPRPASPPQVAQVGGQRGDQGIAPLVESLGESLGDPPIAPLAEPPASSSPLGLVLSPTDDCWVSLTIDGDLVFSRVMRAGERASFEAEDEIVLNIGDAGAFGFLLNDRDGRALGGPGEVRTARITRENYRTYLAP